MFRRRFFILQLWHPYFVPNKNKISKVLIWVHLQGLPSPLWNEICIRVHVSMVGRSLACDEQTLSGTWLDYAKVCVELNASLSMVHVFQLRCRLFMELIIIMVDYEWNPGAYEICKVFGHLCKASIKASNLSAKDMLKIKK
jgi:hypothetical protein